LEVEGWFEIAFLTFYLLIVKTKTISGYWKSNKVAVDKNELGSRHSYLKLKYMISWQ
jgi:hypothetical protein